MRWFQKFLITIATVNMVISPAFATPSNSGSNSQTQAKVPSSYEEYKNFLEPLGYKLVSDPQAKRLLVYQKDSNTLAMEIPFAEESELRRFSPKSLNQKMLEEMMRIKTASQASWSHSVANIKTESLVFFMAMGAVVAGQLITNYSQNPIAMQQHIEHSMSPIGVFGFFIFMYSQGVTSNVLGMYMKNPRFHHMIPYLGMTVGSFLQSYLSQVASDPNVKACAKQMLGPIGLKDTATDFNGKKDSEAVAQSYKFFSSKEDAKDEDPCSKAYEYLVIHKKIWEFAPGIVSMLVSSGLAGLAQSAVAKGVLRLTGVDISMWLIPGGMQMKGIRLLLAKGIQIAFFVSIDAWLSGKITYLWKNFTDGMVFYDLTRDISAQINSQKKANWSISDVALQQQLREYREKMADWRMMNLAEVYEAHQNWSAALLQMTSMYNSSRAFYESFNNEIRNSRYDISPLKLLNWTYPFNGITAKNLPEDKKNIYLTNPDQLESMQVDTILDAVGKAETFVTSSQGVGLSAIEKAKLASINTKFKSENRNVIYEGLKEFLETIQFTLTHSKVSDSYKKILREMYVTMGKPQPVMEPGRGYLLAYENSPSTKETFAKTSFYRKVGQVQTLKFTDNMMMQMICGPDLENGEKSIKQTSAFPGFPSIFLPPTIRNPKDTFDICDAAKGIPVGAESIFRQPFLASQKTSYTGPIDYLIHEARPSFVGDKTEPMVDGKMQTGFADWWTKNVDSQMRDAFEVYAEKYDEIVVNLINLIYKSNRSAANSGPVPNGAMSASFQEERVYLSMIAELLKPSPAYNLDLRFVLQKNGQPEIPALKDVETEFEALNSLLKKIRVTETIKDGKKVKAIQSDLENYQLSEQVEQIQAALGRVSSLLGIGEGNEKAVVKLNQRQANLATTCLENLQSLATEIMMYGSIANAVSWDKIRNLKKQNLDIQKYQNEIQSKLHRMSGNGMLIRGN